MFELPQRCHGNIVWRQSHLCTKTSILKVPPPHYLCGCFRMSKVGMFKPLRAAFYLKISNNLRAFYI